MDIHLMDHYMMTAIHKTQKMYTTNNLYQFQMNTLAIYFYFKHKNTAFYTKVGLSLKKNNIKNFVTMTTLLNI